MTQSDQLKKTCEEIYKGLCIIWEHEANFDLERYNHFYVNPLFSFVSRNINAPKGLIIFTKLEMQFLGNVDAVLLLQIIQTVSEIRDNMYSVDNKDEFQDNSPADYSKTYSDEINVNGDLTDDNY